MRNFYKQYLVHNDLDFQNGFYIEAGAFDGVRESNTLYLEENLNWKGILIEPNVKNMDACRLFRNPNTNIFHQCALSSNENITELYGNFDEKEAGPNLTGSCSSTLLDLDYYDEEFKKELKVKIEDTTQIYVPARTLNSILDENNILNVDFLSLDVEGYELEVLRNFNFSRFNIRYILIETADRPKYQEAVASFMSRSGYAYYAKISRNDDLYVKISNTIGSEFGRL